MPEGQTLEFKAKSDPTSLDLSKDDKRNLGRSLSAFSNATGGVLLFGITTARKSDELSDGQPAPITQLRPFEDRGHGLVGQLISPPTPHIELYPITRADGSGYLAIRVDPSDARPHMSMAPDHQRYYLRSGANTLPMPDFLVRDMLRMRTSPKLRLAARFEVGSSSREGTKVELVLTICNEGRVSARYPYISVGQERGGAWDEIAPFSGRLTARRRFFEASAINIHPDLSFDPAKLVLVAKKENGGEARFAYRNYGEVKKCIDTDLILNVEIGCQDMPAQRVQVSIPAGTFEDAVDRVLAGQRRVEVDPVHIKEVDKDVQLV